MWTYLLWSYSTISAGSDIGNDELLRATMLIVMPLWRGVGSTVASEANCDLS